MKKNKANYRGQEGELYLIVELVCCLCRKRLTAFYAFKKKYTEAFLDDILQSLQAAQALPARTQRQGVKSEKRKVLLEVNEDICGRFQTLLRYMADAFDESRWKNKRKEAGGGKYLAASRKSWLASVEMQGMALDFMKTNAAKLAEGGMPETFAAEFAKQNVLFKKALVEFTVKKMTAGSETAEKKTANNALYKRLQGLMQDAQEIYAGKPAVQAMFSYEAQRKKISSVKKTGFRIDIKAEKTLVAVKKASVWFLPTGEWFEVEKQGVIEAELPAGEYRYVLSAPGYEDVEGVLVAHTGMMHRVYLVLKQSTMVPVEETTVPAKEEMEMTG